MTAAKPGREQDDPDNVAYCLWCRTMTWHIGTFCEWNDMHRPVPSDPLRKGKRA